MRCCWALFPVRARQPVADMDTQMAQIAIVWSAGLQPASQPASQPAAPHVTGAMHDEQRPSGHARAGFAYICS
jgi:hypothetical protein